MNLESEKDIIKIIYEDQWMMGILEAARTLDLPDWWICAGFVRSKIWDVLHDYEERTAMPDIDVIYFDEKNREEAEEKRLEKILGGIIEEIPWSVKNEARMHLRNNMDPYSSSEDAISKFPETATALGVRLDINDQIQLTAPHGVADVLNMVVKPTPLFRDAKKMMDIYSTRIKAKKWDQRWHKVRYF